MQKINTTNKKPLSDFCSFLLSNGFEFQQEISLNKFSYFRTGGVVSCLIFPHNYQQLIEVINTLNLFNLEFKVVGATSNILFLDNMNQEVMVSVKKITNFTFNNEKSLAIVGAGMMIPSLVKKVNDNGAFGFSGLNGIPAQVGGAIFMNAGAYGDCISDYLYRVDVINLNGELCSYSKEELDFSFRKSRFKNEQLGVIVQAYFKIKTGDTNEARLALKAYKKDRLTFQEKNLPNLGSAFATYDIYTDLAKNNSSYRLIYLAFKVFYKIHIPNNNIFLNYVTAKYFGWKFDKKPYSDKTLNCLVNRGIHTNKYLEYISILKKLTNDSVKLENEIFPNPLKMK